MLTPYSRKDRRKCSEDFWRLFSPFWCSDLEDVGKLYDTYTSACACVRVCVRLLIGLIVCFRCKTIAICSHCISIFIVFIFYYLWKQTNLVACSLLSCCRDDVFNCVSQLKLFIFPGSSNLPLSLQRGRGGAGRGGGGCVSLQMPGRQPLTPFGKQNTRRF